MAFDRLVDGRGEVFGIVVGHRQHEIAHQEPVAAAMAAVLVVLHVFRLWHELYRGVGAEVGKHDLVHVARHVAHRAHHAGAAAVVGGEGLHREGGRNALVKLDRGDIMVGLIVLHFVDATPVIGGAQISEDGVALLLLVLGEVEHVDVVAFAVIDLHGRVGAVGLHRAPVHATGRASLWGVLLAEPFQVAECRDRFTVFTGHPAEDVEVVARLGQDDGCGGF